ncbi:hypothetical protein [Treponema sp.]|uniref:hypothetical protein n=1 Tax=Treponema sp. TaxID=166 RepID=UPI003890D772
MRKKLNVFNTVLFTLIFCFMLGNCEDISFDKSLVKQIEDDTTCTVRFYVGNPIEVPVGTENPYVDVKYKIGQVITADELPDSNDKRFANLNGSWVIKNWKWVTTSAPLPDDIIKDSDGNIISIRPTGVVIELFGNWVHGCTLTLMDGCSGASAGKEFSGNYSGTIKFWTGENVKIPEPEAQFKTGDNVVEFGGWYADADLTTPFSSASLEPDGYYHYSTNSSTQDTTLYAKWKYKYVYVDPQNSAATDDNSGIDSTKPLKTVAEAKKYLKNALYDSSNPSAVPAVKLMSAVKDSSDFTSLSNISTTTCNYAVLTRWSGYKGSLIDVSTSPLSLENTTLDGGSEDGMFSTEPAIWSTNNLTLENLTIKNFNSTSMEIGEGMSAVYCSGSVNISGCTFENLSSRKTSYDGSALYLEGGGFISNTSINVKKGNGIACTSSSNAVTELKDVTINNDTGYSIYAASDVKVHKESTGSYIKNVDVRNNKKMSIGNGVTFDTSEAITLQTGASVDILNNLTLTSPATYIAKIYSNDYGNNPTVLTGSGTLVADNYTKFACAHSGYGINSDGKIVPIGSISIGIDNPSGFTEIDLGDLAVTQVNLSASGDTVIRFNLNSGVADKLAEWTRTDGVSGSAHPIQYMIGAKYGCVAVDASGTYADIVIGTTDNKIPNAFKDDLAELNEYPLTKGLHTLQIYSEAKEANAVVTKKTYNIVVK